MHNDDLIAHLRLDVKHLNQRLHRVWLALVAVATWAATICR